MASLMSLHSLRVEEQDLSSDDLLLEADTGESLEVQAIGVSGCHDIALGAVRIGGFDLDVELVARRERRLCGEHEREFGEITVGVRSDIRTDKRRIPRQELPLFALQAEAGDFNPRLAAVTPEDAECLQIVLDTRRNILFIREVTQNARIDTRLERCSDGRVAAHRDRLTGGSDKRPGLVARRAFVARAHRIRAHLAVQHGGRAGCTVAIDQL